MDDANGKRDLFKHMVECISNPIRLQFYLAIQNGSCSKASEIHSKYPDVPRATMYRHLNHLTKCGLIQVIDETKKRGSVERTYVAAKALDLSIDSPDFNERYFSMFIQYIMEFVVLFHNHCIRPDINVLEEKSGFSMAPIYASDEELEEAMRKISSIIQELMVSVPTESRKRRTIGMIISPPSN